MSVTRRDFSKAVGSFLLLPTWFFQRAEKVRQIDLSLFCGPGWKYDMETPFWQEGHTYATDARVCVRTNLIVTPPSDSKERRLPRASDREVGWNHDITTGWQSDSALVRVKVKSNCQWTCPSCFGVGHVAPYEPCKTCSGDQWITTDEEYEKKCPDCFTGYIGRSKCLECRGSGEVDYLYRLGSTFFAPEYVAKLRTLGPLDLAEPTEFGPPMMIRFDGGEALLMPVRQGDERWQ